MNYFSFAILYTLVITFDSKIEENKQITFVFQNKISRKLNYFYYSIVSIVPQQISQYLGDEDFNGTEQLVFFNL